MPTHAENLKDLGSYFRRPENSYLLENPQLRFLNQLGTPEETHEAVLAAGVLYLHREIPRNARSNENPIDPAYQKLVDLCRRKTGMTIGKLKRVVAKRGSRSLENELEKLRRSGSGEISILRKPVHKVVPGYHEPED